MKHILFLIPLLPCLALAQGTVKDSVRVLTTAEIIAVNTPDDTTHVYFIQGGSWKKIRMDSLARLARLKLAGDRGDIDVSADGLTWTVDTNAIVTLNIANGAVDSTKLAAGAVQLAGAKVTGTLPVSNGGTGQTTLTANKVMIGNGTSGVLTPTNLHWDNENMRLGIDTSLPINKLDVAGSGRFSGTGLDELTSAEIQLNNTTPTTGRSYVINSSNGGILQIADKTASGATRLVLNASGNLGLGVTPSAWNSATAMQVQTLGIWGTANDNYANFSSNSYYDGSNNRYISNQSATSYQQYRGNHYWLYAPSGTAGNAISYTQAMGLDASGRLVIGATEPTERLHVVGNARITAVGTASASNATLYITNTGVLSTNSSDANKKHNVRNLPYGLNTINQLTPVAFEWNGTDETDIGFIAQDIAGVIPESVISNYDSEFIFRQEKIIPVLVKAMQQQQAQIEELKKRIIQLENK